LARAYLTALQVASLPSDPNGGKKGQIYFNSTTNKFRGYTTTWQDLGSGSGGGGGGVSSIFVDYTGQQLNNNQYFSLGNSTGSPQNPLINDLWVVTDDADNVPYFIAEQTTAPDPTQYEFWADPSDYGGDLIYTASETPAGEYSGQLWIKPDDIGMGEVIVQSTAPDPTQFYLWADSSDTQSLAQYAQIYNSVANFPNAANSPGLFAVEGVYGRAYYSFEGNWIALSALSDSNSLLDSVNAVLAYSQYLDGESQEMQGLYWVNAGLV